MRDIQTRDDLLHIITVFYEQLMTDPIIGFYFTDLAQLDLSTHIPQIANFWAFQLLGERNYQGNVFAVHLNLHRQAAMSTDHFHRWVFLLHSTVDRFYSGPMADTMKQRAAAIAQKMQYALATSEPPAYEQDGLQMFTPTPAETAADCPTAHDHNAC